MTHETVNTTRTRAHTAEQVAEMYQTPPSTIKDLARRRVIPCLIVGGKYRFLDRHLPAIDEHFEQQAKRGPAQTPAPLPARRRPAAKANAGTVTTALRARPPRRRRSA